MLQIPHDSESLIAELAELHKPVVVSVADLATEDARLRTAQDQAVIEFVQKLQRAQQKGREDGR